MKSLPENPKVSVLIAAYNAEKYIEDALNSIIKQTYTNLEILICDDASEDHTKSMLQKYDDNRIQLFFNNNNLGYLKTMNKLFGLATGDLITTQDADDFSELNRVELQVKPYSDDPELGLCGTNCRIIDKEGKEIITHLKSEIATQHEVIKEVIKYRFPFSKCRLMFRREVLDEIGPYRLFFNRMGWEDYDWTSRAVEKFKAINLSNILYNYRVYEYSVSVLNIDKRKHYGDKIVQFFIKQRQEIGKDALDSGDLKELNVKIEEFNTLLSNDSSMIYRTQSHSYINMAMYRKSLTSVLVAIKTQPLIFKNYTNFIYCCYVIIRRILKV